MGGYQDISVYTVCVSAETAYKCVQVKTKAKPNGQAASQPAGQASGGGNIQATRNTRSVTSFTFKPIWTII